MISTQAKGFSLVEVLIAVFVLALGVIGAAGLQLAAVRTSQQSGYQTIAVELANELADKMRSSDAQMKLSDSANVFANINTILLLTLILPRLRFVIVHQLIAMQMIWQKQIFTSGWSM
jgi:prepilin-type N-terminal cleavage/methylation domain-containing protein